MKNVPVQQMQGNGTLRLSEAKGKSLEMLNFSVGLVINNNNQSHTNVTLALHRIRASFV